MFMMTEFECRTVKKNPFATLRANSSSNEILHDVFVHELLKIDIDCAIAANHDIRANADG